MTRILVCGGRNYRDQVRVDEALDAIHAATPVEILIHGDAAGADTLGADWARRRQVPIDPYPAKWDDIDTLPCRIRFCGPPGRRKPYNALAGFNRNLRMILEARPHLCVCFPGGNGTADMRAKALYHNIPVLDVDA